MKASYNSSTFGPEVGGIPYFTNFQAEHDMKPNSKLFPPFTDSLYELEPDNLADLYLDPQTSCHYWDGYNPLIQDPEPLNTGLSLGAVPTYPPAPPYNIYNEREDMSYWSYEGLSSNSNSPAPSIPGGGVLHSCPSLSPAGSSVYSEGSPSPLHLNEFANIFDFDFSTALPNEFPAPKPAEYLPEHLPPSISRRRHSPSIPSRSRSPRHLSPIDFTIPEPREASPSRNNGDCKRRYPCLILGCARRFTSQYTLKVHMEAHRPKPRPSFPCTLGCSEKFSRQHDRLRHEVAKHGKVCEFSCDDCGRFFSTSKTLGNHKCPIAQGGTRWVHV